MPSFRGGRLPIQAWRGCFPGICRCNPWAHDTDPRELAGGRPRGSSPKAARCCGSPGEKGAAPALQQPPSPLVGGQEQSSGKERVSSQADGMPAPPTSAEATEILPTSFRALITLSRQSLYLYEFVLKKPHRRSTVGTSPTASA